MTVERSEPISSPPGEDLYNNPVYFEAAGYWATPYTYSRSGTVGPSGTIPYGQDTSLLTGADSYTIALYSDFALTGATLRDAGVVPIPEPETWAMLLAGLGLLGAVVRRSRRKHA